MKISICMPYYNRKRLLKNTLHSISRTSFTGDIEICLVDDNSYPDERIEDLVGSVEFPRLDIKVKRFDHANQPCPVNAHNLSIAMATGDILIIQNPECYHNTDILAWFNSFDVRGSYVIFACWSGSRKFGMVHSSRFSKGERIFFNPENFKKENSREAYWFQHSKHNPRGLNFCVAANRAEFIETLGGFDPRYGKGLAFGDDDLIRRVRRSRLTEVQIDIQYVIHQWHAKLPYPKGYRSNQDLFLTTFKEDIVKVKNQWL